MEVKKNKKLKPKRIRKVSLIDIHDTTIAILGTTDTILAQQTEISRQGNQISEKNNELLSELSSEIKHGNESRGKQTEVLNAMISLLSSATRNNSDQAILQSNNGIKILFVIAMVTVVALMLICGVIIWQDLKDIKEVLPL